MLSIPQREADVPLIMGILNVTPDSFSDGGKFNTKDAALDQARKMLAEGADIIDIGGESTRPGAEIVSLEQEIDRVCPIVEALVQEFEDIVISVDTSSPKLMQIAHGLGAYLWNDIRSLRKEGALDMAVQLQCPVCIMHMQGKPATMQKDIQDNAHIVDDVYQDLITRASELEAAGIQHDNIIIDPGFGFGKTAVDNYNLLKALPRFVGEYELLVGMSRKSMIGYACPDTKADERLGGSVALATMATLMGANILRVHDVKESKQAALVCRAFAQASQAIKL